jgi:hypothetical protein
MVTSSTPYPSATSAINSPPCATGVTSNLSVRVHMYSIRIAQDMMTGSSGLLAFLLLLLGLIATIPLTFSPRVVASDGSAVGCTMLERLKSRTTFTGTDFERSAAHQCTPPPASVAVVIRPRGRAGGAQSDAPQTPSPVKKPSQFLPPAVCSHADSFCPIIVVFGGCIGERLHIRLAINSTDESPGNRGP